MSTYQPRPSQDLQSVTIGEPIRLDGAVILSEYDPLWPDHFETQARRVLGCLGERVLGLHHVGSTSVPGLSAKPVIDMLLLVADSAREAAYVPDLERSGFALRIREPDWHEHRMFEGASPRTHLHVFSAGCPEVGRMLAFRDRLRSHPRDRMLYEQVKRELAQRTWAFTQDYADAKTAVVQAILSRADAV